ncbi:MAG: UbiA family prenyltransferase [Bacteroidetes bacterium]|nr:UbiA family prenyltransferase [Bacteroidota bacterium]
MRTADFFIFSSLYISLCAVLMVYQTSHLFFHKLPPASLLIFVFFSTICSYNFHWYLTPHSATSSVRVLWTQKHKMLHLTLYTIGLIGSAIYFFVLREHWMALLFAVFVTFLYSAPKIPQHLFRQLKDIALGKTIFLALVWMYVTTLLPVFISNHPLQLCHLLFASSRFFLIYSICIIFDYRDREDDKSNGIRSLITYFGEKGINNLFILSLALFFLFTCCLYFFDYSFRSIIILLVPGAVVAGLYNYSKKNFSDYLYYFVLDGLMMFSGLLMIIFNI